MIESRHFADTLKDLGIEALYGIPDSTLKQFCDYIGTDGKALFRHCTPANEGAAAGMAIGSYLATGKPACVYMQNSGLGNIVNPLTSLASEQVYRIPMLFLIGWRGEPGVHDEPQHKFMGQVTLPLLDTLQIPFSVIDSDTTEQQLSACSQHAEKALRTGKQYAIVIKKGTFGAKAPHQYQNSYSFVREQAIRSVLTFSRPEDIFISTTGKISRELYEQSDALHGGHDQAFLTVGGMGHASMIALAVAQNLPQKQVYCIDGDGAMLMHMGSLAVIGREAPANLVHICLNNAAHESVGGMPTGAAGMHFAPVAKACGYPAVFTVADEDSLQQALQQTRVINGPVLIEVLVSMESREDLGRPRESARENADRFMRHHGVIK